MSKYNGLYLNIKILSAYPPLLLVVKEDKQTYYGLIIRHLKDSSYYKKSYMYLISLYIINCLLEGKLEFMTVD